MASKRPIIIINGIPQEIGASDSLNIATGQTYNVNGVPHTHAASGLSYSVISTNTTAQSGAGYLINASSGNVTLTLPSTPSEGDIVAAVDIYNKATTNTITIARNGSNIEGFSEDIVFDINGAGFILVYADATRGWEIVSEIGAGSSSGLFEIDIDGGLMPVTDNLSDEYYDLDDNGDIQPIA